jgi:hypothetical protein
MVEGSNTRLRIIRRLPISLPTFSIYTCVCVCKVIYNSNGGDYNIKICL